MQFQLLKTLGLLLFPVIVFGQSLPIAVDGQFGDWEGASVFQDATGDGALLDFAELAVANDENYLFLRLKTIQEFHLTEDNSVRLYLDTDDNSATGKAFNGLGAELIVVFGQKEAEFYPGNFQDNVSLYDIGFHSLPTVSGNEFEIAIGRNVLPDFVHPLFNGSTVRLALKDGASGDVLPPVTYQFDETPVPAFTPITLEKENPGFIRLMTYNTLYDGLDDFGRMESFKRIVAAIQPDIVTFNECWDLTPGIVATFMNAAIPLPNFQNWQAVKLDAGNVTVSRFPILQSWDVKPGSRLTASLIDLPGNYPTDLLVVNGHLKCCDADYIRQQEADAFVKFILDAKSPGGVITLPENTPFVLSGDLNLVGDNQPLETLLTGEIVNTGQYGPGGALDWDETELTDAISLHTDERMAFTWSDDSSDFPPSRIDYHIYSNSVLNLEKGFTLKTETMTAERLAMYGLEAFDTYIASDHLPKVSDFSLTAATATTESNAPVLRLLPNPFSGYLKIEIEGWSTEVETTYRLLDANGKTVRMGKLITANELIETGGLAPGIYFLEIIAGKTLLRKKAVKF